MRAALFPRAWNPRWSVWLPPSGRRLSRAAREGLSFGGSFLSSLALSDSASEPRIRRKKSKPYSPRDSTERRNSRRKECPAGEEIFDEEARCGWCSARLRRHSCFPCGCCRRTRQNLPQARAATEQSFASSDSERTRDIRARMARRHPDSDLHPGEARYSLRRYRPCSGKCLQGGPNLS